MEKAAGSNELAKRPEIAQNRGMNDTACQSGCGPTSGEKPPSGWLRVAVGLSALTVVYNVIEAVASVYYGSDADSIALVGFGLDSMIEVAAAAMILWRLLSEIQGTQGRNLKITEATVHRFVGFTFFLLAGYIGFDSAMTLIVQEPPRSTVPGVIIAVLSLVVMPLLAWGKIRAAQRIGSGALRSEAKETIACAMLSAILLAGLGANALAGWWWADPIAGLLMIPWLLKEGRAGLRGESCCG